MLRRLTTTLALLAAGLLLVPAHAEARKRFKLKTNPRVTGKKATKKADDRRFKIESFRVNRITGRRFELNVGASHTTSRRKSDVVIYYVDGAQKHRLWRDKIQFSTSRGGFTTSMTVNLAGRQGMHRAHLEVVALACKDLAQCRRRIDLSKGDLRVDGRPEFRTGGSSTRLTLKVKNSGPARAGNCRAVLKVGSQTLATQRIGQLNAGRSATIAFDYPRRNRDKSAKVHLECNDLERTNNTRSLKLR